MMLRLALCYAVALAAAPMLATFAAGSLGSGGPRSRKSASCWATCSCTAMNLFRSRRRRISTFTIAPTPCSTLPSAGHRTRSCRVAAKEVQLVGASSGSRTAAGSLDFTKRRGGPGRRRRDGGGDVSGALLVRAAKTLAATSRALLSTVSQFSRRGGSVRATTEGVDGDVSGDAST